MTHSAPNLTLKSLAKVDLFKLLGVSGSEEEKQRFLDELQDLVWQEFIDTELMALLDEQQMDQVIQVIGDTSLSDEQQQQQLIKLVEQVVPDYEQVLVNKALELKADMLAERIEGLKERFAGQAESLAKVKQAEELLNDSKWQEAVDVLGEVEVGS